MVQLPLSELVAKQNRDERPKVPFCRKEGVAVTLHLPVFEQNTQQVEQQARIIVFGGKGRDYTVGPGNTFLADIWALHITNNGLVWKELQPHGTHPLPRWKFAGAAYNGSTSLAIYGGDDESGGGPNFLDDLWLYELQSDVDEYGWTQWRRGGKAPGPRRGVVSAVTSNDTLLVQGGKLSESNLDCTTDLVALDLADLSATGRWKRLAALPVPCRWGHSAHMAHLPNAEEGHEEQMVMFGGRRFDKDSFTYYNALLAYDPIANEWSQLPVDGKGKNYTAGAEWYDSASPPDAEAPSARDHHSAVYVEATEALWVFGGRTSGELEVPLNDLWSYSFRHNQWTEHVPAKGIVPIGRFGHSMSLWRGRAGDGQPALVVFGGETVTDGRETHLLNDVWMYVIRDGLWRQVAHSDCHAGAQGGSAVMDGAALITLAGIVFVLGMLLCVYNGIKTARKPQYEPIR